MSEEIKNTENVNEEQSQSATAVAEQTSPSPTPSTYQSGGDSSANNNKKLIKCSVCGNDMAKNAKKCPNCGAKNKKPFYKRKLFWIIAVVVLCILINLLSGLKKPESVVQAEDLIDEIGKVSIDSEEAIIAAEQAVAALTGEEKERVGKLDKLEKAREKYDELALEQKVTELQDTINAIGTVTLESADKIKAARTAYDNSKDDVKNAISNYNVLTEAEKQYSALNVDKVVALINAIGEVNLGSGDKIEAANDAYKMLTEEDKTSVTNSQVLKDAQTKLVALKKADKDARAKVALAKLKADYDKVEGITWYEPSAMPQYIDTRSYVLPYIGMKDSGYSWLRLKMNYTGDSWIFWEKITFVVDGERYYKSFGYYDITRDNDSDVWEYADISVSDSDIELLNKIVTSNETIVRFEGDNKHKDITISATDKTAIKQVLDAYAILSEE